MCNNVILPRNEYIKIQKILILMIISGLYALFLKLYDLSFITLIILTSSYNHWRLPRRNSIQQQMDKICVFIGGFYEIYKSYFIYHLPKIYYSFIIIGIYCYIMAKQYNKINKTVSANWHCGLHFSCFIYNMILYTFISLKQIKICLT
jgi:hypothetical protein